MLCNKEEFQKFCKINTNLLFVILLVMQIAGLIKTKRTSGTPQRLRG